MVINMDRIAIILTNGRARINIGIEKDRKTIAF